MINILDDSLNLKLYIYHICICKVIIYSTLIIFFEFLHVDFNPFNFASKLLIFRYLRVEKDLFRNNLFKHYTDIMFSTIYKVQTVIVVTPVHCTDDNTKFNF